MSMTEEEAAAARRKKALLDSALTLLLARVGGEIRFTESDYHEALEAYGGTRANLHFEILRQPGVPDTVVLRLEDKAPANAELIS